MTSSPKVVTVARDDSACCYRVKFDSGFQGTYPYVWLRDNCRCPECYHPSSSQRILLMTDLDPDVTPASEALADDGRVLSVTWPDQHRSDFDATWLNRQRFSEMERDVVRNPELQTWGAEMNGNIPTFEFKKLLEEDLELYNWLNVLNTKGLAVVKGAPTEKGALHQLAERVAYLKRSLFGEVFQVISQQTASSIAYTPRALGLHVDESYLCYLPAIQMLHCIERTNVEGGENQFVDGLHVAEQMRQKFPDVYKLLTTQEVEFRALRHGENYGRFHLARRRPTIQYQKNGVFQCINFSNASRACYQSLPVEQVTEMYRALKLFDEVMNHPNNLVRYRMAAGDMVTFSNGRVLHGRSAYTVTSPGGRHLEGGFMDWDEAHSRMRVLREKLFGYKPL